MFNFDLTIKLSDILTILSFLGIGVVTFYNIKTRLDIGQLIMKNLAKEIESIKETIKENAATLLLVATQKIEIDYLKKAIDELKHGEGFVLPLNRKFPNQV